MFFLKLKIKSVCACLFLPKLRMSINVIVSIDLSSHASIINQNKNLRTIQVDTEYETAIQAVLEILQEYDRYY